MRAVESRREDRLFEDPLARQIADLVRGAIRTDPDVALPTGPDDVAELTEAWYMLATYIGVRTRYYDERVRAAATAGIRQVVILAAGFDSRAIRLDLPADTAVYEVDTEPVLRFKESVLHDSHLEPTCARRPVAADLRGAWTTPLRAAGFDPGQPTMWLIEGLLMYLAAQDCEHLLADLTPLSAPGSRLALEYFESNPRADDVTTIDATERAVIDRIVGFFQTGPALPPDRWLGAHSWTPDTTTLLDQITGRGRRVPEMFQKGRPHEVNLWLAHGELGT